jgi:DNA mismatch repair protein MutS2
MHAGTLRALEFDRVVTVVRGLAVTPTGQDRLAELHPATDASAIAQAQRATSEGTRFLTDRPGFPLRAPVDLDAILYALGIESRGLEPLRLLALADYLESIEQTRGVVTKLVEPFPILRTLVDPISSFAGEIAEVQCDPRQH